MEKIITYTAGGAKGSPGPAAAGVYITDASGNMIQEEKKHLGNAHGDFASYYAVMLALQTLSQLYCEKTKTMDFEVRLGSELIQKQLSSLAPINEPGLVPMFIEIHNMSVASFPNLTFVLVPQAKNKKAESLVAEALDGK